MFSNLIEVYRVNNDALHPPRFSGLHLLFGQSAERVAVALRSASSNCESFLHLGIVWREKNTIFGFDGQKSVARRHAEAIGHVFRKSCAYRAANSAYGDFFDHVAVAVGEV